MEMSRRRFLEVAAVATTGLAALGAAGCTSNSGSQSSTGTKITPSKTVDCDVVVVGVGVSGISACVEAAELGANVVGIDRAVGPIGTNATMVKGMYGVGDPSNIGANFKYLTSTTYYQYNNRFVRRYLDIIDSQVARYISKGCSISTVTIPASSTGSGVPSVQHMWSQSGTKRGNEISNMLTQYSNLTLCWETEVIQLLADNGKVTGVYAKDQSGVITQYNAKGGVIVCTGGFANNTEMMKKYMGGATAMVTGSLNNDGAGIKMLQAVGGQMGKNYAINATEGGAMNPKASCGINVMDSGYSSMLRSILMGDVLINRYGKRFVDEAVMCKKTMMFCSEPVTREGGKYYAIMTQAEMNMLKTMNLAEFCLQRYGFKITNAMILIFLAANPMPNFDTDAEKAIKEGWCWKGTTFKELEEKSGIPNIATTMDEYNQMCAQGVDTLLYKDPAFLKPYNESDGPFYLVENYLGLCCTQGGIRTDGECHALNSDFTVIDGLYVAGMDADNESTPYIIGATCQGFCVGAGYIAAENAVARAKSNK